MNKRIFTYCPICSKRLEIFKAEKRRRLACPKCGWIKYENPLPSVAALVRNEKGEVLLVKRGVEPGKEKWALPSGFIEIEETPEKACLRELKEETGLKGKRIELIGVYSQRSKFYKNVLIIGYEIKATGKISPGSDSLDAKFFPIQRLPRIPFSSHREIIKDALRKGKK
jgi:8-oxo-dGTP diphosphatase